MVYIATVKIADYIELNALAIIYSCMIGQVHLLVYYIKLKSHPSVRIFLVEWFFAVDARIHVKLARNEAPVFWEHKVCFYNVLTPAVRHLRRFECQGVDDQTAAQTQLIIYTTFVFCDFDCPVCCGGNASDSRITAVGLNLVEVNFFFSSTFFNG